MVYTYSADMVINNSLLRSIVVIGPSNNFISMHIARSSLYIGLWNVYLSISKTTPDFLSNGSKWEQIKVEFDPVRITGTLVTCSSRLS